MCEYCKDKKEIITTYDSVNEDTIRINDNILEIESSRWMGDRSSEVYIDLKIQYCPFCGNKL